jgi:hypothetical protein
MLLFSRDEAFIDYMAAAFPLLLTIGHLDAFDRQISEHRVDTIIIDCDDHADGIRALKAIRQSRASGASACIAVVNGETDPSDAHDLGAWLVVEKTSAWRSLEPLHGWLQSVRRREHRRFALKDAATIDFGDTLGRRVQMLNISIGGASFITEGVDQLEHRLVLKLAAGRFPCEVVWREPTGRVGVRFLDSRFGHLDLRRVISDQEISR